MKNVFNRLMGISLLSLLLIAGNAQTAKAQDVYVSYQTFYDNLAPYGQWVYDPDYGNVWVPNEAGDFRPYGSRGYWAMTDYGNTWVSEDPWGWAVYHYGRWTYDPYYGWVWIPGYEWAPAWVSWRYGGGYAGWAPMGPGVSVGVSFNYPDSWWIFVAPQYMYRTNCYSYWRGPQYNTTYIRQTTIINNYYVDNSTKVRYNYGPRRDVIERDTHQPVEVRRLERTNRPGAPTVSGNRVNMYRPAVDRNSRSNARPSNVIEAPRRVGRPQQANTVSASHQPAFRQEVQRRNPAVTNNDQRQREDTRQNNDQRQQQQDRGRREPQQRQDRNDQAPGRSQRNDPQQREQRNDRQPDRYQQRNDQQQREQQARNQRDQEQRNQQVRHQQQREQQARSQRDQEQRNQQMRDQQQREQQARNQRDQEQRNQQMRDQQQRNQQMRDQQMREQQQRDQQQRAQQMRDQQQRDQQQRQQQMRDQQQREQQQRDQQQRMQQMREQQQRQQQQAPRQEPQRQMPQGGREHGGGRR